MAPPSIAAGPLEGVEALRRKASQPPIPRYPRLAGSPVGGQPEGLLAALGLRSASASHADQLLDRSWSGADRRSCPSSSGALANRRMRTRTSGGVGGAGLTPAPRAPLRFSGPCRSATGPILVWCRSAPVSVVFGSTGEPPDADPHVRWCGRGWANPGPYPIPVGVVGQTRSWRRAISASIWRSASTYVSMRSRSSLAVGVYR